MGANLTGNASALDVPAGNTLTLNLNGFALIVTAPAGQAATGVPPTSTLRIEGPSDQNAPWLTVTGGPNSGTSSAAGAGIGGDGGQSSGHIEIAGGRVSATGGSTNGEPGSGAGTNWSLTATPDGTLLELQIPVTSFEFGSIEPHRRERHD